MALTHRGKRNPQLTEASNNTVHTLSAKDKTNRIKRLRSCTSPDRNGQLGCVAPDRNAKGSFILSVQSQIASIDDILCSPAAAEPAISLSNPVVCELDDLEQLCVKAKAKLTSLLASISEVRQCVGSTSCASNTHSSLNQQFISVKQAARSFPGALSDCDADSGPLEVLSCSRFHQQKAFIEIPAQTYIASPELQRSTSLGIPADVLQLTRATNHSTAVSASTSASSSPSPGPSDSSPTAAFNSSQLRDQSQPQPTGIQTKHHDILQSGGRKRIRASSASACHKLPSQKGQYAMLRCVECSSCWQAHRRF